MEDKSIGYLTEEAGKLRELITTLLNQIEENEKFSLFSSGAIWALVASLKWNDTMNIVIWIPSIIALVFSIKRMMLAKTIIVLRDYIRKTEGIISEKIGTSVGWESYWQDHKNERSFLKKGYMRWWGNIFWLLILLSNILLALFFPFKDFLAK